MYICVVRNAFGHTLKIKLKRNIMKKKNLTSLGEFIDKEVGPKRTKKRDEFEKGYEAFKLDVLIQQARQEKGLTQEQVAELSGKNKSYISCGLTVPNQKAFSVHYS